MRLNDIQKPSPEDRELFLADLLQSIQQYDLYIDRLEERYEKLGCHLVAPSYFNFRDALFHYENAYKSHESIQLHCERHAMLEHLHRALKDGCVKYLQLLNERLNLLYYYPDSPEQKAQIDRWLVPVLEKAGLTKDRLLGFGLDFPNLEASMEKVSLEEHELRTLYEALLVNNFHALPDWQKKLQKVIHGSRNLDVHTRNESMHIRKPFSTESGRFAKPAPIDHFLDQCDQLVRQLETDGLFSFVATAAILKQKRMDES